MNEVALILFGIDAAGGPGQDRRNVALQNQSQLKQEKFRRMRQEEEHDGAIFGKSERGSKLFGTFKQGFAGELDGLIEIRRDNNTKKYLLGLREETIAELLAKFDLGGHARKTP